MTAAGPSALERFERHLAGEAGRSAATREAYLADARLLLELAGATPLEALTPRAIRGCVRQLRQRGHDPRSIARRLSAWRAWFRLLRREGVVEADPVAGIKAPRAEKKLPRPVGVDAAAGFLDSLDQDEPLARRDRAIFELAYSSGLRVSELVGADLADFEEAGTMLRVLGKGGKTRTVPVGAAARAALDTWLAERGTLARPGEPALFVSRLGGRIGVRAVQQRLSQWSDRLGLADKLHPHRLRHACASHFLQGSGDLRATQELLGHASIASTQIYTHLDFDRLAAVYDAAHPRAKAKS
ncbi:tyrosine recombinase XerC [Chitinimonas koreensis]|uniref:tyrosine recombinase XerC n=1 Tax=Chitinimonas koreensis TaxID=356302 RepID=UPI0004175F33|nr:tyrosine recombinase XerC [Chitinimonas koreensis]